MTKRDDSEPVACALRDDAARAQMEAWRDLGTSWRRSERGLSGVRIWFDGGAHEAVARLATREAECCAFLALRVEPDAEGTLLDISARATEGVSVAHFLADEVERGARHVRE